MLVAILKGGVLGLGADVKPCPAPELVTAVRSGSAPPEVDGDTRSAVLPATATDAGISGMDRRERGRAGAVAVENGSRVDPPP